MQAEILYESSRCSTTSGIISLNPSPASRLRNSCLPSQPFLFDNSTSTVSHTNHHLPQRHSKSLISSTIALFPVTDYCHWSFWLPFHTLTHHSHQTVLRYETCEWPESSLCNPLHQIYNPTPHSHQTIRQNDPREWPDSPLCFQSLIIPTYLSHPHASISNQTVVRYKRCWRHYRWLM